MKDSIQNNSTAWLRLAFAITALVLASQMHQPKAKSGEILLAAGPRPGTVQEW